MTKRAARVFFVRQLLGKSRQIDIRSWTAFTAEAAGCASSAQNRKILLIKLDGLGGTDTGANAAAGAELLADDSLPEPGEIFLELLHKEWQLAHRGKKSFALVGIIGMLFGRTPSWAKDFSPLVL